MEQKSERLRHCLGILRQRYNGALRIKEGDLKLIGQVAAFKQEFGLTTNKCAELLGVVPHQLGYLLTRSRDKTKERKPKRVKFREVQLEGDKRQMRCVELVLPSGIKAIFPSVRESTEFLRML